jgi:hypothetical protein
VASLPASAIPNPLVAPAIRILSRDSSLMTNQIQHGNVETKRDPLGLLLYGRRYIL